MLINPSLGLFGPRRSEWSTIAQSVIKTTRIGGIKGAIYEDFLFPEPPTARSQSLSLLGGHQDDTGGSVFEAPLFQTEDADPARSFLVMYCSFVDGIDKGIQLPLLYALKTNFHLSQIAASAAIGISLAPWLAKPVLAMITDSYPIGGLRRTPYIMISAGVNAAALGLIAYATMHSFGGFLLPVSLLTVRTFARAMIDAAAQGLLLEDCRYGTSDGNAEQSRTSVLVSRYQAAHRMGQFLNVVASGYIMTTSSIAPVFGCMAAAHVGTMLLAWSTNEQPAANPPPTAAYSETIALKTAEMKSAIAENPAFKNVLEYAFLSVVVPSYDAPLTYYLIDSQGFTVFDISLVNVVLTTGSLVAPIVYSHFFQRTKFSKLMTWLTLASIPASLMPLVITTGVSASLGLNTVAVAAVSAFTLTLINDLQMMPAHVLIAQLAPRGLEGTSFSVLTVVEGAGRVFSNVVSATLPYAVRATAPGYPGMTVYIALCTVFNIGPFSAIDAFDRVQPMQQGEAEVVDVTKTFGQHMRELKDDSSSVISDLSEMDLSPPAAATAAPAYQLDIKPTPAESSIR